MTPCTEEQALEILRDRSVLPLLSVYPEGIGRAEKYLVGGALLLVAPKGDLAEVHIACKFRDRKGLKERLIEAKQELQERGFRKVYTTAPDSRIALVNMLKSLGFRKEQDGWVWE
jgi:hypothetical protein